MMSAYMWRRQNPNSWLWSLWILYIRGGVRSNAELMADVAEGHCAIHEQWLYEAEALLVP